MRSLDLPLVAMVALLSASASLAAEPTPAGHQSPIPSITAAVSPAELRATIEKLVSFGTRHTLSETRSDKRGIGAARRWTAARFHEIGRACGGCLSVATPSEVVTGARVPTPTEVVDVLAIQRGTSDPNRVIIISGHIDSRVTDVMAAKSDAPGANDDASGTAAVIEAARVLSQHKFPATLVYAVLSGEEQGLYGGKILTEAAENYDRQHQDLRTEKGRRYGDTIDGVDFPYLAQVTRLNLASMAALALAPMPPAEVKIEGAVKPDTTVSWTPVPGAAGYRIWWRSTTAPQWQHSRRAGADATSLTLPGIVIDDWFFGVSAVSADGYESPIEFPGPAGSFVSKPEAPAAK